MSKQEEIIDKQTKCMDATEALRKKEDEVKKLEGRCVCVCVCEQCCNPSS